MAIVRINPRLEAELMGSASNRGPLEHVLGDIAEDIAAQARHIARAEFYRTGAYVRGIRAEHGLDDRGNLVGRVAATDFKSHWAEYGWRRRVGGTRARHILTRAAEQVGYRVVAASLAGSVRGGSGGRALPAGRPRAITGR